MRGDGRKKRVRDRKKVNGESRERQKRDGKKEHIYEERGGRTREREERNCWKYRRKILKMKGGRREKIYK